MTRKHFLGMIFTGFIALFLPKTGKAERKSLTLAEGEWVKLKDGQNLTWDDSGWVIFNAPRVRPDNLKVKEGKHNGRLPRLDKI